MELGNQLNELHGIIYHKIFVETYKEKNLIIDRILNTSLWDKMNCNWYSQYRNIL